MTIFFTIEHISNRNILLSYSKFFTIYLYLCLADIKDFKDSNIRSAYIGDICVSNTYFIKDIYTRNTYIESIYTKSTYIKKNICLRCINLY